MKDIHVGQDVGIVKGSYPDRLCSGSCQPCIAVAAYDSDSRTGYMMHKANMFNENALVHFISALKKDYGSLEGLMLKAVGGSRDIKSKDEVLMNREYVEDMLKENFREEQYTITWLETWEACELYLDLNENPSKAFSFKKEDVSHDTIDTEEEMTFDKFMEEEY